MAFSRQLRQWSVVHAALLVTATVTTAVNDTVVPLLLAAGVSFSGLLVLGLSRRSASTLSVPNAVTAVRFAGITGLVFAATTFDADGHWLAPAGFVLLISDALDGWLARRYHSMTNIGALLDEEVDAFFLLALGAAAAGTGRLGWWILVPGLFRYGFVLLRPLFEQPGTAAKLRSRRARVVFVTMMSAMLLTFLPVPQLYVPATIGASTLLFSSFAIDTWTLVTNRPFQLSTLVSRGRKLLVALRGQAGEE